MSLFRKKGIGVSEELIRGTAKKIVTEVFEKEYTIDNSQTQRIIKEMLKEAGIKIVLHNRDMSTRRQG